MLDSNAWRDNGSTGHLRSSGIWRQKLHVLGMGLVLIFALIYHIVIVLFEALLQTVVLLGAIGLILALAYPLCWLINELIMAYLNKSK